MLRTATDNPLICDVIPVEMASPAASSAELLMRLPVESLSIACRWAASAAFAAVAARIAEMFVLMTVMFDVPPDQARSEEHTSELQSLMRISYAVFCLKKKKTTAAVHYYQ